MSGENDDDIDFEPHTPATLAEPGHTEDAGHTRGQFPPSVPASQPVRIATERDPTPTHSVGSASHQIGSASHRFSHNPYATAGSPHSSAIAVGVPDVSAHYSPSRMTPIATSSAPRGALARSPMSGTVAAPIGRQNKAELCRAHLTGGCARGSACHFAHTEDELGKSHEGSSAPRQHSLLVGSAPKRVSAATMDDGGKMGVAMSQAVPMPSWMSGGSSPLNGGAGSATGSAPIPISPLAEAMMRPSSLPKSQPASAPKFGSAGRR